LESRPISTRTHLQSRATAIGYYRHLSPPALTIEGKTQTSKSRSLMRQPAGKHHYCVWVNVFGFRSRSSVQRGNTPSTVLGSLRLVFPSGQPGSYEREIRGGTHLPAYRRLTISVGLPLPRKPIMMYGDSKDWRSRPVMRMTHAGNLSLTDDPGMSAIPVCRGEFKRHFHVRRRVEGPVSSKQDPGAADVFRPRLQPFWTVGSAIANRDANWETFGASRNF